MNLDDMLADIDGIGGDYFARSNVPLRATEPATASQLPPPTAPPAAPSATAPVALDMVLDVEFEVMVELGTGRIPLRQLLQLHAGDRFPLEKRADELLDLYVNDRRIARGEALVVDGSLAIRIVELLPTPELSE